MISPFWYIIISIVFYNFLIVLIPKRQQSFYRIFLIFSFIFFYIMLSMIFPSQEISNDYNNMTLFDIFPDKPVVTNQKSDSRCIVYGDTGSKTYLEATYGDNSFCDIIPDGVSYKAVCCEGICEVGECR